MFGNLDDDFGKSAHVRGHLPDMINFDFPRYAVENIQSAVDVYGQGVDVFAVNGSDECFAQFVDDLALDFVALGFTVLDFSESGFYLFFRQILYIFNQVVKNMGPFDKKLGLLVHIIEKFGFPRQ